MGIDREIAQICLNEVPVNLRQIKLILGGMTATTFDTFEVGKNLLGDFFENACDKLQLAAHHTAILEFIFDESSNSNDYENLTSVKQVRIISDDECEIYDKETGTYHRGKIVINRTDTNIKKCFYTPSITVKSVLRPKCKNIELPIKQNPPINGVINTLIVRDEMYHFKYAR